MCLAHSKDEDVSMQELEGDGGMKLILERLDRVFKFDAITELPADFETFTSKNTLQDLNEPCGSYSNTKSNYLTKLSDGGTSGELV